MNVGYKFSSDGEQYEVEQVLPNGFFVIKKIANRAQYFNSLLHKEDSKANAVDWCSSILKAGRKNKNG